MATIDTQSPWYKCKEPFINCWVSMFIAVCCMVTLWVCIGGLIYSASNNDTSYQTGFAIGLGISAFINVIIAALIVTNCIDIDPVKKMFIDN